MEVVRAKEEKKVGGQQVLKGCGRPRASFESTTFFFFAGRVAKIGQPKEIFLLPLHWALRRAYQLYQCRAKPVKDGTCGEAKAVRRLGTKF